jgi:hypothetical protein
MLEKLKKAELFIFLFAVALIFVAEYNFIVLQDKLRAIFIGLWPPTIILVLIYINVKLKK